MASVYHAGLIKQSDAFGPVGMGAVAWFVAFQLGREQIGGRGDEEI
jgi:hypothetical protein